MRPTILELDDLRGGYVEVARHVASYGRRRAPRGLPTRDLGHATLVVWDPTDVLPLGVGRKLNPSIAAVEAAQLTAGRAYPGLVLKVSESFREFAEDDGTFWASYGDRVGTQLLHVERKLRRDPDTRQAVITLWDAELDNVDPPKRDHACTLALQYELINGALCARTLMRSNDVIRGLAYDAFQFCQLQLTLARALDADIGTYTHEAYSLHLYESDLPVVERLHPPDGRATEPLPRPLGFGKPDGSTYLAMTRAQALLEGVELDWTDSERWYLERLPV